MNILGKHERVLKVLFEDFIDDVNYAIEESAVNRNKAVRWILFIQDTTTPSRVILWGV